MNFQSSIYNFQFSVIFLLILGLVLPSFCLAQEPSNQIPQTVAEAKSLGMKILTSLPGAVKKVWQQEALPFLLKMWDWLKNIWDTFLEAKVNNLWQRFLSLLGKEVPDLEEEFQKEKEEMQQDLWQRFKDLLE